MIPLDADTYRRTEGRFVAELAVGPMIKRKSGRTEAELLEAIEAL